MILALMLGYSVLLSVGVPTAFCVAGPVTERRPLLGFTFATVIAIAWVPVVFLVMLSPWAGAPAAAALMTLVWTAAAHSWRDERRLARLEAQLWSPHGRDHAVAELRESLDALARRRHGLIAPMELYGFAVRRLIARGSHAKALELLDAIEERFADRLCPADASEARILRARALLQLGRATEAAPLLARDRERGSHFRTELALLQGLMAACGPDVAERRKVRAPAPRTLWSPWQASLAHLVRAHAAAARGDEARAARELAALRDKPYGAVTFDLARTYPGPASALAAHIEGRRPPYR